MASSINNDNRNDLFDYLKQVGLGGVAGAGGQAGRTRARSDKSSEDSDFQDVIDVEVTAEERLYTTRDRRAREEDDDDAAIVEDAEAGVEAGGMVPLGRSFGAFNGTYDAEAGTERRASGFAGNLNAPSPSPEAAANAYLGNTPEGLAAAFINQIDVVA